MTTKDTSGQPFGGPRGLKRQDGPGQRHSGPGAGPEVDPARAAADAEDQALVAATLAGDGGSFQRLVERHADRLFAIVRGYTRDPGEVEDICQEAFLKAFTKLETYQAAASFSTWLTRIAVNTALDLLKRRGRNPVSAVEDPEAVGSPGAAGDRLGAVPAPEAKLEGAEIAAITEALLDDLPEIFRTVLVLREIEELSYVDIAETLGISIGTVESRLYRARARFKQGLIERFPEFAKEVGAEQNSGPRKRRRMRRLDRDARPSAKDGEEGDEA